MHDPYGTVLPYGDLGIMFDDSNGKNFAVQVPIERSQYVVAPACKCPRFGKVHDGFVAIHSVAIYSKDGGPRGSIGFASRGEKFRISFDQACSFGAGSGD